MVAADRRSDAELSAAIHVEQWHGKCHLTCKWQSFVNSGRGGCYVETVVVAFKLSYCYICGLVITLQISGFRGLAANSFFVVLWPSVWVFLLIHWLCFCKVFCCPSSLASWVPLMLFWVHWLSFCNVAFWPSFLLPLSLWCCFWRWWFPLLVSLCWRLGRLFYVRKGDWSVYREILVINSDLWNSRYNMCF